jgi:hypothetical protein
MKAASLPEEPKPVYSVFGFSCPKEIAKAAKQVARQQRRTFSSYIVTLIERDLAELVMTASRKGGPAK